MAWADEWRFTDVVTPSRAAQLRSWGSFNEIVAAILQSAAERFWWEPFRSPRLIGCNRASVTLKITPRVYDGFFNSPQGYRAQYAMSPSVGEAANRALVDALEPLLMSAAQLQGNVAAELIRHSLRAVDAKVWIVEAEVEDQLSDPALALAYAPWEFNSPDGQGLRAPVGTSIEAKGGWLDAHGAEKRDPLKAGRSLQIHKMGFS